MMEEVMKFNIWRLLCIALVFLLGFALWYLCEFDTAVKKNVAVLKNEKDAAEKKVMELTLEKKTIQEEITSANKEKDALIGKINEYETKIGDYENRVGDYEKKIREMASEADRIRSEVTAKEDQILKKTSELSDLKKIAEEYRQKIKVLNKKILQVIKAAFAPPGKDAGQDPVPGTAGGAKDPANSAAATLAPITVKAPQPLRDNFKVLDVNKDYGFIVIDAGAKDDIKNGDSLSVFRNKTVVGRVVVEKVSDDVSIAKTLYKSVTDTVRKGDAVSY